MDACVMHSPMGDLEGYFSTDGFFNPLKPLTIFDLPVRSCAVTVLRPGADSGADLAIVGHRPRRWMRYVPKQTNFGVRR